jgi:hypothetical protein
MEVCLKVREWGWQLPWEPVLFYTHQPQPATVHPPKVGPFLLFARSPPHGDEQTLPSSPSSGFLPVPLPCRWRHALAHRDFSRAMLAVAGQSLEVRLEGVAGAPASGGPARRSVSNDLGGPRRSGGSVTICWLWGDAVLQVAGAARLA